MKTVLGLDPASTTGFYVIEYDKTRLNPIKGGEFKTRETGIARCADLARQLIGILDIYTPEYVCLEALAFGHASSIKTVSEINTVLRYFLWQRAIRYGTVPPATLKKFITGKGNAPKDTIMMHVLKNWGIECRTNNIADACGLAFLGAAICGKLDGLSPEQKQVVAGLNPGS